MIGVPFQSSMQAIGGSGFFSLTVTGDVPPGLKVETGANTVAVGGVPTATGEYQLKINVADVNGNTLTSEFTIHVYPQVPGAKALVPIDPTDTEAFTFTDKEDVFFPAKVIDNENFTFTDSEKGLDAAVIVDNEHFTFTDSEKGLDAAVIVDTEKFSFTDTESVQVNNAVTPVITWATPVPITYGTALSATQLDASSTVAGTFEYSPPLGAVLGAGSQILSVDFAPTDTADYTTASKTVTLGVNQAPLTVTASSPTVAYGSLVPAITPGYSGFQNGDTASVVTVAPTCTTTYTTTTPVNAPSPLTSCSGGVVTSNYSLGYVSGTVTVTQAASSITWNPPSAITYGTALSATQLNATSTVPGSFTYTPALGTVLGAGTQTLSVTFTPTDAIDYTTATQSVSLVVNQATPAITWGTPTAITYGTALSATQLNASTTPAGAFAYTPAAGTVLTAGSHTLSVTYTPSDTTDYTTATATVTLVVNQATPTITWATPAPIIYGTALSGAQLDASSTVAGTFAYTPAAGTVLNAGSQMLSVTLTPTDTTDYTTATTSVSSTVNQEPQTITLSAGTLAYASEVTFGVAPLSLSATATSGLPVTFSLMSGAAVLSSNTLTIGGAGAVVIAANQPGNGNYAAAPQITETIPVNKAQPIAAISSSVNPVLAQNGITLTATVTSGAGIPTGTVTFLDGTAPLGTGTVSGGVATFTTSTLAAGSHSIAAAYGGDANFLATTSTPLTQLVEDFGFTISSQTVTVLPGGSAVFTFTVSPIDGTTFPAAITLTASGLPAGATYTFSPKGLTAGEGATTVTLTVDVPQTLAGINPAKLHPNVQLASVSAGRKTGPRGSLPVGVVSRLAPFALAFILLPLAGRLRRAGKRLGRVLSVLVLLGAGLAAIAGIGGCGSTSGFFAQQQETYTVTVTGTSGALSHSATVTLTVE